MYEFLTDPPLPNTHTDTYTLLRDGKSSPFFKSGDWDGNRTLREFDNSFRIWEGQWTGI